MPSASPSTPQQSPPERRPAPSPEEHEAHEHTAPEHAPERASSRQGIGAASLIIASGTMVSRVLGFVRVIVLAQTIGVVGSASADAFANANSLPSAIYSIIAGGMLNAVLVPQVVRAAKDEDGGQRYINRLVTLGIILLGALAILGTLAAPLLSRIYGASLDARDLSLVIAFAYWCLPQIFFYGLYTLVGEVLNARGSFGPFTWSQVLNNVVSIAMLVVFGMIYGADPTGQRTIEQWTPDMIAFLGGSTTLAVALQALIVFAFWKRVGLTYRPDFHFRGIGLRKTGQLAGWTLGMLLVIQGTVVVETIVANLAFGVSASVAALQNALLIFILPHSIITLSIATAYFTRMSEAAADGDDRRLAAHFADCMRLVGFFIVFSGVGLMVLSTSFSRIFEARPEGTLALALTLCAFLIGLPAYSALLLAQRMFYAKEDTRTLFIVFAGTMPIHVFGMALAALLPTDLIVIALALLESFAWTLRLVVLVVILRVRLGPLGLRGILASYLRFLAAALIAGAVGVLVMFLLGSYRADGFGVSGVLPAILACAIGGTVMVIVYLIALRLLRAPELETALDPVARALGRIPGMGGLARIVGRLAGSRRTERDPSGTPEDAPPSDEDGPGAPHLARRGAPATDAAADPGAAIRPRGDTAPGGRAPGPWKDVPANEAPTADAEWERARELNAVAAATESAQGARQEAFATAEIPLLRGGGWPLADEAGADRLGSTGDAGGSDADSFRSRRARRAAETAAAEPGGTGGADEPWGAQPDAGAADADASRALLRSWFGDSNADDDEDGDGPRR